MKQGKAGGAGHMRFVDWPVISQIMSVICYLLHVERDGQKSKSNRTIFWN